MNSFRRFPITVAVSEEEHDRLAKLAITRGVSKSELMRQMIEDYWNKAVKKGTL